MVYVDSEYIEKLDTSDKNKDYFYLKRNLHARNVYIYFRDWSYNFNPNLELCLTDEEPEITDAISDCNFITINYENSRENSKYKEYFYNYVYPNDYYKYTIFHYTGKTPKGVLKVKLSYSKIYDYNILDEDDEETDGPIQEPEPEPVTDMVKEEINEALSESTVLSIWLIMLVIIGAFIGLSIIITIIVIICICTRKKTYYGQVGCYNPTNIDAPNPAGYPFVPQTPY